MLRSLSLKRVTGFVLAVIFLAPASFGQAIAPVISVDHGPNTPEQISKPYVILVSLDGFRYNYARKYAEHLLALAKQGASAPNGMLPSYPSITFPNHYTIVTGLYPEHHGIVGIAEELWKVANQNVLVHGKIAPST